MKNKLISTVLSSVVIVLINGCGSSDSNPKEAVTEATKIDTVAFSDLSNHRIVIRERNANNANTNEIVFCENNMVKSGIFKNGSYDASAPTVTMTFNSATEILDEEDLDAIFRQDENVQFNGSDYIITDIFIAPFAVCN